MRSRPRSIRCALLTAVLGTAAVAQHPTPPAPKTLALLVGIKDYQQPKTGDEVAPLRGPENDVARVAKVLVERFGFAESDITTLIGEQATHEGIVTAFHRHLIARAGAETSVVFWFSGHGSRVPDASGRDGAPRDDGEAPFDDTLLAWDSRAVDPAGSFDLTDDELHSLLLALRSKDVVVVTDCCHSGGLLRGKRGDGVRESDHGTAPLDRKRIAKFWPHGEAPFRDDDADTELQHVVHVAACSAMDEAGEHETATGMFGTLTWFLTQTLREVEPLASWAEVGAIVRARVAGHGTRPAQGVRVTGATGRTMFGGTGRAVQPGFQVDVFGARRLLVAAGSMHGLGVGAELQLVGLDGKALGPAMVERVDAATSLASWQGKEAMPRQAMRAVPKSLGAEPPALRVAIGDGVDAELLTGCAVATRAASKAEADCVLERAGERLELRALDGAFLRQLPADRVAAHVELLREHYFRGLWQGIAEPGRHRLTLWVELATAEDRQRWQLDALPFRASGPGASGAVVAAPVVDFTARTGGGLIQLCVHNCSDENVHLAIVSVSEHREVAVVHGKHDNNVLGADRTFRKCVWVGRHAAWPADRPLVDRYVAIATTRYADFRPFASEAPQRATRGTGEQDLPPFLRAALGGGRVRGAEMEQPNWGIAHFDLQLVTPKVFEATKGR